MKKLRWNILLAILLVCLAGCAGKRLVENEADYITTADNSTEKETDEAEVNFSDENAENGFDRIAITFYGNSGTRIGLSWYTPYSVDYGNDVELLEKSSMKKVDIKYNVQSGKSEYDEESMYHQTYISDLRENTEYYFRVGDKSENRWSSYGSFKTGGKNIKEFTFAVVTDTQNQHLPDAYFSADTMETAVEEAGNPAFLIHCGDFVDNGSEEYLWSAQLNAASDIMMNNIIVPAVGNHEESNHSFWQHFMLEKTNNHKTTGIYYSFDYGNAHFTVLDTNKVNESGTSYIDDEQLQWLENDLKQAKENGAKWLIVNMHKGLYTVGEHADNEKFAGEEGARIRVGQIFEKYGVNLVLQGHDHCPSVTKPVKSGNVVENDGVIYVNVGSSGAKTYTMEENMDEAYYELFEYIDKKERNNDTYQDFAVVSVTEESIKVVMYEKNILKPSEHICVLHEIVIE